MGRDETTEAATASTAGTDPLVVALARARTSENEAVFEQLDLIARIWDAWLPTDNAGRTGDAGGGTWPRGRCTRRRWWPRPRRRCR